MPRGGGVTFNDTRAPESEPKKKGEKSRTHGPTPRALPRGCLAARRRLPGARSPTTRGRARRSPERRAGRAWGPFAAPRSEASAPSQALVSNSLIYRNAWESAQAVAMAVPRLTAEAAANTRIERAMSAAAGSGPLPSRYAPGFSSVTPSAPAIADIVKPAFGLVVPRRGRWPRAPPSRRARRRRGSGATGGTRARAPPRARPVLRDAPRARRRHGRRGRRGQRRRAP